MKLFVFLFLFSVAAYSQDSSLQEAYKRELIHKARELRLSTDQQWINLVHYKETLFGGYKSQIAGDDFFLAPHGQKHPDEELEATLINFFVSVQPDPKKELPQCKYPARYLWLKEKLQFDSKRLPELKCPKYEKFRESVNAKSATVVFTSYFLNNPSSAFGHSFLRLNKSDGFEKGERYELLDYGINYAANVTTTNPVLYAVSGLFGLFNGTFTSIPFYYKVREYNDFESRDLWGYDLNLTPQQIKMLVAHVWELGSTYFNYWYLSENCSYHIIGAIDAANPDLHLTDRLPHFFVVPIETIKVMMETPGLVRSVHYRPSVRTQLDHRYAKLNESQVGELKKLVKNKNSGPLPDTLSASEKAAVLDTTIDYADFHYSGDILLGQGTPAGKWKQDLLITRSRLGLMSEDLKITPSPLDTPHESHRSIRTGLAYGNSDGLGRYGLLNWRFALHDLLDRQQGYPEYAQIEFFNFKFRYLLDREAFWLDEYSIFSVVSLSEFSSLHKQMSWRFRAGYSRVRDASCDHCGGPVMEGGVGLTLAPFDHTPFSIYALGEGEVLYSQDFAYYPTRFGVGPTMGMRARFGEKLISLVEGSYRFYLGRLIHGYKYSWQTRYALSKDFALNLEAARYPDSTEGSLGFFFYF